MKIVSTLLLVACCTPLSFASSDPSPDQDASVVYLRTDCGTGSTQKRNCFETMSAVLNWTWGGGNGPHRNPQTSQSSPLLIEVGPGEFGNFVCEGTESNPRGWVTVRGAGRDHTVIKSANGVAEGAVYVENCTQLSFSDLTVLMNDNDSSSEAAVVWYGSGSSTWVDMDVIARNTSGRNVAWFDHGYDGICGTPSVHNFYNSRLRALGATTSTYAFGGNCSENWFYGGEIFTDFFPVSGTVDDPCEANNMYLAKEFHAFGSAIWMRISNFSKNLMSQPNSCFPVDGQYLIPNVWLFGNNERDNPVFQMHGGIIGSSSAKPGLSIVGLLTDGSGSITTAKTQDTAFSLSVASTFEAPATAYRILNTLESGVTIESPFSWGSLDEPPLKTALVSLDGMDTYVENDCSKKGDCDSGEDRTGSHVMVLNEARCPAERWFNTTTGQCRGVTENTLEDLIERVEALEKQ